MGTLGDAERAGEFARCDAGACFAARTLSDKEELRAPGLGRPVAGELARELCWLRAGELGGRSAFGFGAPLALAGGCCALAFALGLACTAADESACGASGVSRASAKVSKASAVDSSWKKPGAGRRDNAPAAGGGAPWT